MRNLGKKLRLLLSAADDLYSLYIVATLANLAADAEYEELEFPPESVQEELKPLPKCLTEKWDEMTNFLTEEEERATFDGIWPNQPDDDDDEFFFDGTPRLREE